MEKLYDRIDFANGTTPALNQTNLNAMSKGIDDIDDRVIQIANMMESATDDYEDLTNKPKINNVELSGNKTSADLSVTSTTVADKDHLNVGMGNTINTQGAAYYPVGVVGQYNQLSQNAKNSFVSGMSNNVTGDTSIVAGNGNKSSGSYSAVLGLSNEATGSNSVVLGKSNKTTSNCANAIGYGLKNSNMNSIVVGNYNTDKTGVIFAVGNGSSDSSRHNALEVTTANKIILGLPAESEYPIKASSVEDTQGNKLSEVASDVAQLNSDIVDLNSSITTINSNLATQSNINNQQSRDIKNLYEMAKGNLYTEQTDDTVARVKTIPSGACTYGTIDVLCGMSRKGKNLFNATLQTSTISGITCTKNSNGTYTLNGTPSGTAILILGNYVAQGGEKVVGCSSNGGSNLYLQAYNSDRIYVDAGEGTIIANSGTYTIRMIVKETVSNVVFKPMITTDTSATYNDYEPYTENLIDAKVDTIITKKADNTVIKTKTIPQSIKSLDGYGIGINSTCYNYIDFDRKVFVKKVGSVDLGSLSYTKYAQQGMDSTYYTQLDSIVSYRGAEVANIICAKYETTSYNAWNRYGQIVSNTKWLQISDNNYSDATTFKNAMNGQILYYELATPTETDISSMLDTDADILTVEENGTLSFHYPSLDDGYSIDMPSTETYLIKL